MKNKENDNGMYKSKIMENRRARQWKIEQKDNRKDNIRKAR